MDDELIDPTELESYPQEIRDPLLVIARLEHSFVTIFDMLKQYESAKSSVQPSNVRREQLDELDTLLRENAPMARETLELEQVTLDLYEQNVALRSYLMETYASRATGGRSDSRTLARLVSTQIPPPSEHPGSVFSEFQFNWNEFGPEIDRNIRNVPMEINLGADNVLCGGPLWSRERLEEEAYRLNMYFIVSMIYFCYCTFPRFVA